MKISIFSIFFILFLNACATSTRTPLRQEEGQIIAQRQNLKSSIEPPEYIFSIDKIGGDANAQLKIRIAKYDNTKEEWDDIYSTVNVYGSPCENLSSRIFNTLSYPAAISEVKNAQICETKDPAKETIIKHKTNIVDKKSQIDSKSVKLSIGGTSAFSRLKENTAIFDFKTLKLNPNKLPSDVKVLVNIDNQEFDLSNQFSRFVGYVELEQNEPENKYKMQFCSNQDLYTNVFMSQVTYIKTGCIYTLGRVPLVVLQVIDDGILVGLTPQMTQYLFNRTIFIKTNKQYVDDDPVQNISLKSIGVKKYYVSVLSLR
ncbi:MAG: hypothetical protein V4591_08830 [Bdellovibrionota bacterium]